MRPPTLPLILSRKADYYALWHAGRLGNKLRSWASPREIPSHYRGGVMIRDSVPGWGSAHVVPRSQVPQEIRRLQGRRLHFNEAAPDAQAILQGEILREPGGIYLFAAERRREDVGKLLRMRDVLPFAKHYRGLAALHLLRRHLHPSCVEDLEILLDLFEDHVVEFSAYSRHLGDWPSRNAIIWEVRRY